MPFESSQFSIQSPSEIESQLSCDIREGLSGSEVLLRQKQNGKNIIQAKEVKWWHVFFRQFRSPFIYLLLGAGIFSFSFGEHIDAYFIFIFVVINTSLGFYQEYRSENILKTLKKYLVSYTIVRRDGKELRVDKSEVVLGDVVLLQSGDMIPADVRIIEAENVEINESVLTGESQSSLKTAETMNTLPTEPYQAKNLAFSGTTVMSGRALAVVVATGAHTVFGGISKLTTETNRQSDFEIGMKRVSTMILKVVAITFLGVFFLKLFFISGNTLIEFIIFSIALSVSVIPEGLPLVVTFTLSYGAKKLAENKVVVKRLSSIEDLGSIEILCTDKTGTITENKMRIAGIFVSNHSEELVLHYARLASVMPDPHVGANPFDEAIFAGIHEGEKKELSAYERKAEIPFDPIRRRNTVLVQGKNQMELIVRGAPEEILKRSVSHSVSEESVQKFIREEGKKGHRVIGVAFRKCKKDSFDSLEDEEKDLEFLGCISLYDPLKKSALEAISRAESLGVQIKVLTGDGPEVSQTIGVQAGILKKQETVITGAEFMTASYDKRKEMVEKFHVFARVSPEEKYEIIKLLEEKYTVGFLGEGINDAPALKVAHVGMVVDNASDVAREAADIILLKQSLLVIIKGIEEGRRVFSNNIKYLKATLASNFGNFYAVVAASFLTKFLPMLPIQILLLNFLSDFPMMSIAADTVDAGELKTPRHYNIKDILKICLLLGAVSTVFDFLFFGLFYRFGPLVLHTNWFMASVLTELLFLFSIRTRLPFWKAIAPARAVTLLTVVAAIFTLVLPFIPTLSNFFHFTPPKVEQLVWIGGLLILYLACTEFFKLRYYKKYTKHF